MRQRNSGYNAATARAMAKRTANREKARKLQEAGATKLEIASELGVSRATVNLYLRTKVRQARFVGA